MRIVSGFAIVCILITGCVTLPPGSSRRQAVMLPATAPALAASVAVNRSKDTARALSLEECIETARRNNPSLAAGAWDVQTAVAQRNIAAAERWPSLSSTDSYRSYVQPQRLQAARYNAEPGMFSSGIVSADLVLRMPLFTGGRIRNEIRAGELLTLAAESRLARTWEEMIFNISSAFYTVLVQRHLIESLQFSHGVLTKHRERVSTLMAHDKAAKVDVLRTEVRIADLDQRLIREKTTLEIQRRLLDTLMGAGQGTVDPQGDLSISRQEPDLGVALAMAYAERGDYRSARAALDAQLMKVRATVAAKWPKISLEGSYGIRAATSVDDDGVVYTNKLNLAASKPLRGPWPNPDVNLPVGNLGVVVDYPLFDGGRINSQVREQEARLAAAQQLLRKLEIQIRLDVETALLNVSSARQRVHASRKAIEQSKESFRIEQEKYELGKGSITDVLDAQSAMLEAETNYYRALSEFNIAVAQLGLATGEKR